MKSISTNNDHSRLVVCLLIMGILLMALVPVFAKQLEDAKELEQSLAKAIKKKDDKGASNYSYQLAQMCIEEKQYNKAAGYLLQNITHNKKSGDNLAIYQSYISLGGVYTSLKKHNDAAAVYEKAATSAEQLKNSAHEFDALVSAGASYAANSNYKKATTTLEKALPVSINAKDESRQLKCYASLSEYYQKLGNSSKANAYQNQYKSMLSAANKITELKKTVKKVVSEKEVTQLQLQDKTTQLDLKTTELGLVADSLRREEVILKESQLKVKESQIMLKETQMQVALLNKDKELAAIKVLEKDAQLANEQLWRNSIILFFVLSGALVSVVIVDYRKKIETNKKIAKQSESIKSSINYAKRIQEAMLPKHDSTVELLANAFILFKPRDVVSGDFYWFAPITNGSDNPADHDVAFAAVDCTGHGVPGAFMSMIGMNSLNTIIGRGVTETNQILNALHTEIRTALRQPETGNNDGMDITLCIYRKKQNKIEFSGAKNSLVYIQNNELKQIKADVHPIGGSKSKESIEFKKHEIIIDQPTTLYLYSDGYKDQFSGKDGAKFMSGKLHKLLAEIHTLPLEQQKEILNTTIEDWKGGQHQTDDILIMGIQINPQA